MSSSRSYLDSLAHTVPVIMSAVLQQGSPSYRVFQQEAERGAELTCIPEPTALPTPKRPKQKIIGTVPRETKNVQAGRRKGKQDANQKCSIQFPEQPGLVQGVPPTAVGLEPNL